MANEIEIKPAARYNFGPFAYLAALGDLIRVAEDAGYALRREGGVFSGFKIMIEPNRPDPESFEVLMARLEHVMCETLKTKSTTFVAHTDPTKRVPPNA